MKRSKKILSVILTLTLCLGLATPAAAISGMGKVGVYSIVSTGRDHTAVIDENGALWVWGSNTYGQLGDGSTTNSTTPKKIMDNVVSVSCGANHTAAIQSDGTLWTWGSNEYDQLGNGGEGNAEYTAGSKSYAIQTVPVKVMDNVVAVNCSTYGTAVIRSDSTLWQSGSGPSFAKTMDNVTAVSCGGTHTAVIQPDGSLWAWGMGNYGQLGNGCCYYIKPASASASSDDPVKVLDNAVAMICGSYITAAILSDGTMKIWGDNSEGQLGIGIPGARNEFGDYCQTTPYTVLKDVAAMSFSNSDPASIAAIKADGTLWMWGDNYYGQLSDNVASGMVLAPTKVMDQVAAVSCGETRTIVVKTDGTLWTWGEGFLGNKETKKTKTPIQIFLGSSNPAPTAIAATQTVKVDGKDVTFYAYALSDGKGGLTNYVKLRDVAAILNGTKGQFAVGWNGAINLETGKPYTMAGGELEQTFVGDQPYVAGASPVNVNGVPADLEAITLVDSKGGNYNYFKLRDLGEVLGFNVGWSKASGIFIETDKPYDPNN